MRINPYQLGLWLMILGIPCSRAMVEIGATLLITAWLWQKGSAGDFSLRRTSLLGPLAAVVAWSALSIAWSVQWPLTCRAVVSQTLEYAAIYVAVSDWLRDRTAIRRVIWLWLLWSVVMAADGMIQLWRGADLIRDYAPGLISGGARMTAAMKYPNDFGAYMALSAVLAVGVAVAEWGRRRRMTCGLAAGIAVINGLALVLTFSRGAWVGVALAALVALVFYRTRYAVPLLVAAGITIAFLPAPYLDRILSIVNIQPGTASQERLLIWRSVFAMIREHPWVGFGLNTYNAMFPQYKDPAIVGTPYAHNCFLQLTAELGLVGLALFSWLLLRVFKQGGRPALRPTWERAVAISLIAAAAGYVVQSSVETNWYSLPLAVMWWVALGLMDGLNALAEDRQQLFSEKITRLAAIRTDRLGDVLMNLPALRALDQRFPRAALTVVVRPPLDELLKSQPGIDAVSAYEPAYDRGWLGTLRWALALRRGRFDAVIALNPTKRAHAAAWLAGVPIRVGYARKWDFLLTDTLPDRKAEGTKHETAYNLELAGLLGATTTDLLPRLVVSDDDRRVVARLLDDAGVTAPTALVALHPWTSDPAKQWPLPLMAELIETLAADPTRTLILIGGPGEDERARHFLAGVRVPVLSFVGRLSLRQLAALLAECRVLVSNDSGPVHVAAAVGTPTVTLFTGQRPAATPRRWGPLGPGHLTLAGRHPEIPIPVEEVLAAVLRQLEMRQMAS